MINYKNRKGKNYEEIFGIEKSNMIKEKLSKLYKNKTLEEIHGTEKAKQMKENFSRIRKGKSYEERYGIERAKEIKEKLKKNNYSRRMMKNKTFEELYGEKKANTIKNNISKYSKGKSLEEIFGKEKANIIKNKIGKGKTYEEIYGIERAKEIKQKKSNKLTIWSKEKIISKVIELKDIVNNMMKSQFNDFCCNYNNICSVKTIREKLGSLDELEKFTGIKFKKRKIFFGKNETWILDEMERINNNKLIRHYTVEKFRIDGYDPVNNIAYEVDEPYHRLQKEKDFIREKIIKEKINCQFVRIDEKKFIQKFGNENIGDKIKW